MFDLFPEHASRFSPLSTPCERVALARKEWRRELFEKRRTQRERMRCHQVTTQRRGMTFAGLRPGSAGTMAVLSGTEASLRNAD
jgi:hypothetical protein